MPPSYRTNLPVSAADRRHAAAVAKQIAAALRYAEALRTELSRLKTADPKFASSWAELSEQAGSQVSSLTAALEWASKAAKGEWSR